MLGPGREDVERVELGVVSGDRLADRTTGGEACEDALGLCDRDRNGGVTVQPICPARGELRLVE